MYFASILCPFKVWSLVQYICANVHFKTASICIYFIYIHSSLYSICLLFCLCNCVSIIDIGIASLIKSGTMMEMIIWPLILMTTRTKKRWWRWWFDSLPLQLWEPAVGWWGWWSDLRPWGRPEPWRGWWGWLSPGWLLSSVSATSSSSKSLISWEY